MLNEIKEALEQFGLPVYYGQSTHKNSNWNYFVFKRSHTKKAGKSECDFVQYYQVAIIHEDFIPEGFEFDVIKAVKEATGLRLADSDFSYNYTLKNETDLVVEILIIEFAKARKGCDV